MAKSDEHISVLLNEVIEYLQPQSGQSFIDGTLGAAGHTGALLQASRPDGQVLAFDRDPGAIRFARERLGRDAQRVTFVQANYADMADHAPRAGFTAVSGIVLDLGLSSRQLDDGSRGFSFRFEGPLDMRFDPSGPTTAADLINNLSEAELADLFWRYGDERRSRFFARLIVANRPVTTTKALADLIAGKSKRGNRIHPATRIFQALRIAVNDELGSLERGLKSALDLLKPGGRMAIISFHSLEDRLVKQTFRRWSEDCICPPEVLICNCDAQALIKRVNRKVIIPTDEEIARNPRSRSAKMRVAEKLPSASSG